MAARRGGRLLSAAWLLCLGAALAGTTDTGDEATDNAVSNVSSALVNPPVSTARRFSNIFRPSNSLAGRFLHAVSNWFSNKFRGDDRRLQIVTQKPNPLCRPSRRPGIYGRIEALPPARIMECVRYATEEVFGVNHRIVDMSIAQFEALEVMLLAQKRGPVRYIEVISLGDYAHFTINIKPLKTFRDHSCLNRNMWCFLSQAKPVDAGFLIVDRHRVISYNYTWLTEGSITAAEVEDVFINQFGGMNSDEVGVPVTNKLMFPTAVAEYAPYNMTHVSSKHVKYFITPLIPHAWCRLVFVTDTGNHRVLILNASNSGQFDYIGQFGVTGEARSNTTGFNWPWGIAVYSPPHEFEYEPTYASVFVVDRKNHRLVKLNLGYPLMRCEQKDPYETSRLVWDRKNRYYLCRRLDMPRLSFAAEYGRETDVYNRPRGLTDPTAVGIFKHYIIVAEVAGNAISLFVVDHQPPYGLKMVTYFKPVQGLYMQGGMAVNPFGYIYYDFIGEDMGNYFSSMFLPESMRESKEASRLQDYLVTCVNVSSYNQLIDYKEFYLLEVGFILNATGINWVFTEDPPCPVWPEEHTPGCYFDPFRFNNSGEFDFKLLNALVFNGTMVECEGPPTPTPPPFLSGNKDGWLVDGKSQSEFAKRAMAPRAHGLGILAPLCSASAALSFIISF